MHVSHHSLQPRLLIEGVFGTTNFACLEQNAGKELAVYTVEQGASLTMHAVQLSYLREQNMLLQVAMFVCVSFPVIAPMFRFPFIIELGCTC